MLRKKLLARFLLVVFLGILVFLTIFNFITIIKGVKTTQIEVKLVDTHGIHIPVSFIFIPFKKADINILVNLERFCDCYVRETKAWFPRVEVSETSSANQFWFRHYQCFKKKANFQSTKSALNVAESADFLGCHFSVHSIHPKYSKILNFQKKQTLQKLQSLVSRFLTA